MSNEERANCPHHEKVEEFHEYALGTCINCGQVRRYDRLDIRKPPRIVKAGRLNGVVASIIPERIKESVEVKQDKPEETAIFRNIPEEADISQNGDPPPVPPRPKGKKKLWQYFEDNKEAILQDYQNLRLKEFYAKWHMTSTTWTKLKRDWELPGKSPRKSTLQKGTTKTRKHKGPPSIEAVNRALKEQRTNHLPDFPEFNEQWSDYVKVNWFETYQALKELGAKQ